MLIGWHAQGDNNFLIVVLTAYRRHGVLAGIDAKRVGAGAIGTCDADGDDAVAADGVSSRESTPHVAAASAVGVDGQVAVLHIKLVAALQFVVRITSDLSRRPDFHHVP